jgi:4-amino-4-deoxy-L-arabinose transferase-like glycosyltransferase
VNPLPWRWILPALAVKLALNLPVAGRYGWHRDELYYRDAGLHPAAGYVDFPPVTPWLARLTHALVGDSLVGLRSFAILAGAGVIVVACLICRRLGGGTTAIAVTAFAAALTPFLLGASAIFQTVAFDQLAWALVFLAVVVVADEPTSRHWAWLGVAVGLALMTKYTAAVLLIGLAAGFALASPGLLRDRGLLLAAAIAFLMVLPNLIWQLGHDWASVDFILHPPPSASDETRPEFLVNLFLLTGPAAAVMGVAGFLGLWRSRRALALAAAFVPVAFFATGGKSYYVIPVLIALIPAGAVAVERWVLAGRRWVVPALGVLAVGFLAGGLPLLLPVSSEHHLANSSLPEDREDWAEEVGWPELAGQAATAYRANGGSGPVVTGDYGEAGAIDLYGRKLGLPRALSHYVTHRYWGPGRYASARTALLVGFEPPQVARLCRSHRVAAQIRNHLGIHNEEWGQTIVACRLRARLGELWSQVPAS